MRILKYHQKLSFYEIISKGLRLTGINIEFPDQDPNISQADRLIALTKAEPYLNPEFETFQIDKTKRTLNLTAIIFDQKYALSLHRVQVKTYRLELGFVVRGDDEEADTLYIRIPFANSSGCLAFATSPIFESKELYEIVWRDGALTSFHEHLSTSDRSFTAVGVDSNNPEELSEFEVKEIVN